MKSTDLNNNTVLEIQNALENEDNKALANALDARMKSIEDKILAKYDELADEHDEKVLASRGVYQLTNEEKAFYDKIFSNAGADSPTVTSASVMIPKTIVERVFEDIRNRNDGTLDLVDFVNTTGASEWLVSVAEKPVAEWGELCDDITKKLEVGFKVVNTLVNKLTCYVPYCKSLIDLGYSWQDAYVREYMALGLSSSLSVASISGTGSKRPWGMAYDYDIATDTGAKKTPVTLKVANGFTPALFAPVFKTLSKNPLGMQRSLEGLTMFVDSDTYYANVYPHNVVVNSTNNQFITVLDQLGIKVRVCETGLTAGQAIIGLPKRYFMEMGFKGNPNGMIEFSDHAMFVQDKRVYKGKLYADGFPKDKNAFVLVKFDETASA